MGIKAPRESELPSDLFMTDNDCGGGNETKRKQLSLKETNLSLFDQGSQSSSCSSQVFVVSRSISLSFGFGGGEGGACLPGLIMDVRVQGACLEILMVTFLLAYEQVLAFIVLSRLSYGLRGLVWSLHGILTIDFCNRRLIPGKWLQFCQKTQKRQPGSVTEEQLMS
jgi:hypothetical protein